MVTFNGRAAPMTSGGLITAARLIGTGVPEIRAVMEVESRNSGFDKQGRPLILFEPHVFWRCLKPGPTRERAAREGIAYPKWRKGAYPKDSYPRLLQAIQIDEEAALKACSWGLCQILGENHKLAGYPSARMMVEAFMTGEDEQLAAMARFIVKTGLAPAIKTHDWARLARGYNGAGYAAHNYDGRLAAAYAKWARVADPAAVSGRAKVGVTQADQHETARKTANGAAASTGTAAVGGGAAASTMTATEKPSGPIADPGLSGHGWAIGMAAGAIVIGMAVVTVLLMRRARRLEPVERFGSPHPMLESA